MADTDVYKVSILGKDSIHCGFHLAPYIARTVLGTLPASTYVLITDTNIARLHPDTFQKAFNEESTHLGKRSRFLTHTIPPGETSKSRDGKAAIEDFLLLNKCTRDTVILALGGGVIGDLVGFVAATLWVPSCFSLFPSCESHITFAGGTQHARRAFRADPDDAPRHGRLERGRKDRDRHAARQEPHRRVLAARVHLHRRRVPRDSPRARILEWHGRGRQGASV
jgi:hypothetical protein